ALLYFEVVTTLALVVGLVVVNLVRPGDGLPLDLTATMGEAVAKTKPSGWDIALHLFPSNLAKHAYEGDILPIVVFAVLFGVALVHVGEKGRPVMAFCEGVAETMFAYTGYITKLTPIGVFGAMAYNVSHMAAGHRLPGGEEIRGWGAVAYLLVRYARLVGSMYLALIVFVLVVLVPVMLIAKVPIARFARAIREPVVTAFSTASSEAALPRLLERVVELGVPRRVASFVIPAGYSFNLDGSTLYLVLASVSIAQAAGIHMPIGSQIVMMLVFMLTSKGVAGVPRATLVIIAATCHGFGLPGEAGVAMLLAVDEVMDMARTAVNVLGNGLASVVIARWEGVFESEGGAPPAGSSEDSPRG
ncbi:MAG: cation:dicarboxylase symporter family transporter, partial [Myxococcales bacterium]